MGLGFRACGKMDCVYTLTSTEAEGFVVSAFLQGCEKLSGWR